MVVTLWIVAFGDSEMYLWGNTNGVVLILCKFSMLIYLHSFTELFHEDFSSYK